MRAVKLCREPMNTSAGGAAAAHSTQSEGLLNFAREVSLLRQLRHDGIIAFHGHWRSLWPFISTRVQLVCPDK